MRKTIGHGKRFLIGACGVLLLLAVLYTLFAVYGGIPLGKVRPAAEILPLDTGAGLVLYHIPGGDGENREMVMDDPGMLEDLQTALEDAELRPVIAIGGKELYQTDRFSLQFVYAGFSLTHQIALTKPAAAFTDEDGRTETYVFRNQEQFEVVRSVLDRFVTDQRR